MKNDLGEKKLGEGADRGAAALLNPPLAPLLPQNRPAALALDTNDLAICRLTPAIAPHQTPNSPNQTKPLRFRFCDKDAKLSSKGFKLGF
jgi:hypothetical protein